MTVEFTDEVLVSDVEDSEDSEIQVIRKCVACLNSLAPVPQTRVVQYLSERFA